MSRSIHVTQRKALVQLINHNDDRLINECLRKKRIKFASKYIRGIPNIVLENKTQLNSRIGINLVSDFEKLSAQQGDAPETGSSE